MPPESSNERVCRRDRALRGRVRYARKKAVQFAIRHRLIVLNDKNEVVLCFGKYFDDWDKPETFTGCPGSWHIYNIEGEADATS